MKNNVVDSENYSVHTRDGEVARYLQVCGSGASVLVNETGNGGAIDRP